MSIRKILVRKKKKKPLSKQNKSQCSCGLFTLENLVYRLVTRKTSERNNEKTSEMNVNKPGYKYSQ